MAPYINQHKSTLFMQRRMLTFLLLITILAIFVLLSISFLGFWQATHPVKLTSRSTPSKLGWQYEAVKLTTTDKLKLDAWFIPADKETKNAVIILHGYPAEKSGLLPWAAFLKADYNLLFFDFRYFGNSEGSFTSLGYHEVKDVLSAIDFLKKKDMTNISVMGFSFGGAVALLTTSHTKDISAVVTDSAYASIDAMAKVYYGGYTLLEGILTPMTKLWGRIIYGIDIQAITPFEQVKHVQTPMLIIHSQQDDLIAVSNAYKLKEALIDNKNAQVLIVEGGGHNNIRREVEPSIVEFFKEHMQ